LGLQDDDIVVRTVITSSIVNAVSSWQLFIQSESWCKL